jgi:hypothetical protein
MRRASRRGCAFLVAAIFVILMTGTVVTGCGSGTPSSPSETPGPSPSPSNPSQPAPAPSGLGLSSLTLSQSSVQGQQQPTGVVTLNSSAPSSGVIVQLASSNPSVAQVPATVMIAGGQSSASFAVNTSTVPNNATSTISATYNGGTRTATLSVLAPGLEAIFGVSSPVKGSDGCVLGPRTDEADCVLDASNSRGFIGQYVWTYWTGSTPIGHSTEQARSALQIDSDCAFFENGRGGDDSSGNRYVQMTVQLIVQDRVGTRSAPVQRTIRLYPNRMCGFSY